MKRGSGDLGVGIAGCVIILLALLVKLAFLAFFVWFIYTVVFHPETVHSWWLAVIGGES